MNLITKIIAAIRYPESAWGKALQRVFPFLVLVFLLIVGFAGFATYHVVVPGKLVETIDPSSFLLRNYQTLTFAGPDSKTFEGWFIPSVRGAPVVFLCHGYQSNRAELLTLASTFQENGFNLFLFNFRGHGSNPVGLTTLGVKETQDLLSAIDTVTQRADVDHDRVGAWGVSMGAYTALSAAISSPKIRALVIDSTYDSPGDFVEMETASVLGLNTAIFTKLSRLGFLLLNPRAYSLEEAMTHSLGSLAGREKLFITNEEAAVLETQTLRVFNRVPQPKELLRLKRSKTSILYDVERKNYENTVVDFFKKNLPIRGRAASGAN